MTPIRRRFVVLALLVGSLLMAPGAAGLAGPSITPVIRGAPGANGWYRSNVTINWQVSPAPDSTAGCDAVTISVDTTGKSITCAASWSDGTSISVRKTFKVDRSVPRVSAAPDRAADANGWYNHPLRVSFSGADATSGVSSCSQVGYGGPDTSKAAVSGGCTDRAGNVGRATYGFKYDSTPAKLGALRFKRGNRRLMLSWMTTPDARFSELTRAPGLKGAASSTIYRGPKRTVRDKHLQIGASYLYTVTIFDQASNRTSKTVTVTATGPLLNPAPAAHISSPPRLVWLRVPHAGFYNVQLFHLHKKILSVWPTHTHLRLGWNWRFRKHHFHLAPGKYRWYVWPGFRNGSAIRYGRRIGGSTFFVTK